MSNLALAKEHVLFHHKDSDGWITVAKKDLKSGFFRQYHYRPEELADALSEWMGENVYFSQNTFYKPRRAIETIRQLRSLYVDLDVYTKGMEPEWVLGKLELEYFRQEIPEPNMVIFSGRGLVLIWNIEPVPYKAIPLWRSMETYLIDRLKEFGADAKASDPTRIFRIAGSINSKSGTMVKTEYRHSYRYVLRDLQSDYLPELTPSQNKSKPGRKKKIIHLYNVYTLHIQRARDVAKLVEIRNGNVGNCREYICFLYRYFTCCFTDNPREALECTLELNQQFTKPLPEKEVIKATASAEKAWAAKSNKAANEAAKAKGYPGAGYNLKNKDLIDWLHITDKEQEQMSTIIGTKEKNRRRREERRKNGMLPREEYLKQQKEQTDSKLEIIRAYIEKDPKISIRKLAQETGMSKSAIQRLKARL
ncbi:MAG: winged helix-turn-helix domain-containing protein [Agathobacter sp.]|nr:winged helix-turn-helix domain-containing protein [Agathobacter sp.]